MERHVQFTNHGLTLYGALHLSPEAAPQRDVGLLFLHGWAGYRIGPHQMFTKMARRAAAAGFASLRFDFRGRGDSEGDPLAASLATMISDAQAAARVLREEAGVGRICLVGDCSGGEVAFGAGVKIAEADSMVLWSVPLIAADRAVTDRAKRRDIWRRYGAKLFRRESWSKLVGGRLNWGLIRKAIAGGGKGAGEDTSESPPEDQQIDWWERVVGFRGGVLYVYGGNDPTTPECLAHYERLSRVAGRAFEHHIVAGANHAFYSLAWEQEVMDTSLHWLQHRYRATFRPGAALASRSATPSIAAS